MHAKKLGRMMPSKAEILLLLGSVCQAAESRLLSSSNRYPSQYTSYNGQNANASGDHPYLSIVLGIVLSAVLFTGFIFIVDRETFYEVIVTKMKCSKCTKCSSAGICALTSCSKPDIDDDNDCGAPNISPQYITPETAEYFKNKHDEEFEKPKRVMLATQKWVLEQSSKYLGTVQNFLPNNPLPRALAKNVLPNKFDKNSDEDKYQIRDLEEIPTEEQTMEDKVAYQLWHGAEEIQEKIEDVRVRMFWKPTKNLDKVLDGKDKYNVEGEEKEIDIQCNSWFEEDANAPWS
mmetsp:Transcript_19759/g.33686  ORF Transcript_19759/g.33686 Transcript_19759/m.33686 type:complete len:290 (+) Transcript_19759:113-982(+)